MKNQDKKSPIEYLVVSDKNTKVILSTLNYAKARTMANMCRQSGGQVTIFKSTRG